MFCGGWEPTTWPVYEAVHEVDNWDRLIERLVVIRQAVANQKSKPNR